MLTVSSYMDKRSAKLKLEALGRIRVALVGSPPNCFYSLMEDIFGYKYVQQGTPSSTQQPVPSTSGNLPTDPQAFLTTPDISSGSETIGARGPQSSLPNPYAAGARAIRPGSDQKRWSCTGLAKEFNLKFEDDIYHCPSPNVTMHHDKTLTLCVRTFLGT